MNSSDGSWGYAAMLSVVLITLTLVGCSQHQSTPISEETARADQHLPFDGTSDKGGIFPTGSLTPTAIPAGTPLAVHLRTPLSSATSRAGDSFEAVLEEPIVVRGKTLAPGGASVTGKVLDAKPAGELQELGYMRLALTAVSLNGRSFPIQTSSIFVKSGSRAKRNLREAMGASIGEALTDESSIARASTAKTSIRDPSISKASISNASIRKTPIRKTTARGLASNGSGTLIGASTAAGDARLETDYATENKEAGVAPQRRLTFRLAQPLPLEF
jgi:hypothetical protein